MFVWASFGFSNICLVSVGYCNFDATAGRPGIAKYLEKVREAVGAEIYDDVHTVIKEYQEKAKGKSQQY